MEDSRTPEQVDLKDLVQPTPGVFEEFKERVDAEIAKRDRMFQAVLERIATAVERLAVQGEASYEINCHNVEQLRQLKGGIISATLVPPGNRNH